MLTSFLKSKLHPLTVTATDLHYDGSLTLDSALMEKAGLREFEKILAVDLNNGNRFETYIIKGEKDSGKVCVNGAAARLASIGDNLIIMSFALLDSREIKDHKPVNIRVSSENRPL
ncbi:aspartate 1-decarboxylase [Fibrobacterota bacterium]